MSDPIVSDRLSSIDKYLKAVWHGDVMPIQMIDNVHLVELASKIFREIGPSP